VFPQPSTQGPPIRFSAAAEREDGAGDRSGVAMVLMKSSGGCTYLFTDSCLSISQESPTEWGKNAQMSERLQSDPLSTGRQTAENR
jgi:hypothetical protein